MRVVVVLVLLMFTLRVFAFDFGQGFGRSTAKLSVSGADSLNEMMTSEDKQIPSEILKHASCVAYVKIYQGGIGLGIKGGQGQVSCRDAAQGWSAPVFLTMGGVSYGTQLGIQRIDLILLFTNKDAVYTFLNSKFTLGGAAGLTLGPVGRHGAIATDGSLEDKIFSYSISKGLYAGIAFDGAYLEIDNELNWEAYGEKGSDTRNIFNTFGDKIPSSVQAFGGALKKYAP